MSVESDQLVKSGLSQNPTLKLLVLIFDRVASMQETEYAFTKLMGPEPMTSATLLLPLTWPVQGSGFSELTRPVWRPVDATQKASDLVTAL